MTKGGANSEPTMTAAFTTAVGSFTVTAEFDATPGITALFGPSGAGKSVTLATIAGLLRPNSGIIKVGHNVVADAQRRIHVRTQDRQLGVVFQHAALLPHRTPLDNVALAIRHGSKTQRRKRARQWLACVDGEHLADANTATLSGGERQRVAFARALASEPRLLLLDEPFSALDGPSRQALRTLVNELVDHQRLTALLVTHDLVDIAQLADRVVLFEIGRAVATYELGDRRTDELARLVNLRPGSAPSIDL
ncbi:MAG: ATP-binding cassette domain-containing protein [Acidimicrobiales bacterium]|nr:ATP-binding cassette domain-containing protein [Acidimicrobiales bacterium]